MEVDQKMKKKGKIPQIGIGRFERMLSMGIPMRPSNYSRPPKGERLIAVKKGKDIALFSMPSEVVKSLNRARIKKRR
jgi:hypothetical protein